MQFIQTDRSKDLQFLQMGVMVVGLSIGMSSRIFNANVTGFDIRKRIAFSFRRVPGSIGRSCMIRKNCKGSFFTGRTAKNLYS